MSQWVSALYKNSQNIYSRLFAKVLESCRGYTAFGFRVSRLKPFLGESWLGKHAFLSEPLGFSRVEVCICFVLWCAGDLQNLQYQPGAWQSLVSLALSVWLVVFVQVR